MSKFKEMKASEIRPLKEKLWEANSRRCPVLDREVPLNKMVLDHAHKRKGEEYSEDRGVIREALDFRVNAVLGKLENSLKRTGLSQDPSFEIGEFLRNAAEYFERGAYRASEGSMWIHPTEVTRAPPVSKRSYNKLRKVYQGRPKFPEYPRSRKLTKRLATLFQEYEIPPFN